MISRFFNRQVWALFLLLSFDTVVFAQEQAELETVAQVDLERYQGLWHEIARLPNRFQRHCIGNVTANYKQLDDGNIEVINRCLDEQGNIDEAKGIARIVDRSTNAKLEVSFVALLGWNLFWGDYWVVGLGDDYEYAVIAIPSRKYAWILSRSQSVSPENWSNIQQILNRSGYDLKKFLMTKQAVKTSSE